jgi:hypothetical protein
MYSTMERIRLVAEREKEKDLEWQIEQTNKILANNKTINLSLKHLNRKF